MADTRKTILVLEDSDRRIELMREAIASLPVELELMAWDNVWTMRKDLARRLPDACIISLDHDLTDSTTRNPGCGMDMVRALSRHRPICPVLAHTSLPDEGRSMVQALRAGGWTAEHVPFSTSEAVMDWLDAVQDVVCQRDGYVSVE